MTVSRTPLVISLPRLIKHEAVCTLKTDLLSAVDGNASGAIQNTMQRLILTLEHSHF